MLAKIVVINSNGGALKVKGVAGVCLMLKWFCMLLMFGFATAFMVSYLDHIDIDAGTSGTLIGGFVWSCIGLLFAYIFQRSRPAKATIRFIGSSIVVVLALATGAAVLVGAIWVQPERDFIDAQLEGASCGKYTGNIQKGWEEICEEQRLRQLRSESPVLSK